MGAVLIHNELAVHAQASYGHLRGGRTVLYDLALPRHYARKFGATIRNLNENPKLYQQYVDWRDERLRFNEELKIEGSDAAKKGWQRSYMKGENTSGNTFADHEAKIQMKDFSRGWTCPLSD